MKILSLFLKLTQQNLEKLNNIMYNVFEIMKYYKNIISILHFGKFY